MHERHTVQKKAEIVVLHNSGLKQISYIFSSGVI